MARTWFNSKNSRSTGKRYFEIELVALSTGGMLTPLSYMGITLDGTPSTDENPDTVSIYTNFGGTTYVYGNDLSTSWPATPFEGMVIQFAFDLDGGPGGTPLFWIGNDGTFTGDPAAGTGAENALVLADAGDYWVMTSVLRSNNIMQSFRLRSTSANVAYTPPAGFTPWDD